MSISDIPWEEIKAKLPYERGEEALARRKELFDKFDVNKNGYLSLAEVDKGLRDVLEIEIFDAKPAISRAFHEAIKHVRGEAEGPSFVKKKEFRVLLEFLNHYFELWVMFGAIDPNMDRLITVGEFTTALTSLADWGVTIPEENAEAVFAEIDINHGGQVDFSEFCTWAISQRLKHSDEKHAPVASEETIAADFEKYDLAGNGTITKEELAAVFAELNPNFGESQVDQILGMAKLGDDGIVNYKEFIAWLFENGA